MPEFFSALARGGRAGARLKQTNSTSLPFAATRLARSTASIVFPEPAAPVTTIRFSRPCRWSSNA